MRELTKFTDWIEKFDDYTLEDSLDGGEWSEDLGTKKVLKNNKFIGKLVANAEGCFSIVTTSNFRINGFATQKYAIEALMQVGHVEDRNFIDRIYAQSEPPDIFSED